MFCCDVLFALHKLETCLDDEISPAPPALLPNSNAPMPSVSLHSSSLSHSTCQQFSPVAISAIRVDLGSTHQRIAMSVPTKMCIQILQ